MNVLLFLPIYAALFYLVLHLVKPLPESTRYAVLVVIVLIVLASNLQRSVI